MSDKPILFQSIAAAGVTANRQHFYVTLRDSSGKEACIALPTSVLQQFAQVGNELAAVYQKAIHEALKADGDTIKLS